MGTNLSGTTVAVNPNSQLVTLTGGKPATTSLLIADTFRKRHKDVLRAIENLDCSPDFTWRNFTPSSYHDSTGRTLPMYRITRDGFTFLAMGFRGKKAAEFKERYIAAFNVMEHAIIQRRNLEWREARLQGKIMRRQVTDVIQRFVQYAELQGSQNARRYYGNLTCMVYRSLNFLAEARGNPFRDLLDGQALAFLSVAEHITRQALIDGIEMGLFYRDVYRLAQERVDAFTATLPQARQLAA